MAGKASPGSGALCLPAIARHDAMAFNAKGEAVGSIKMNESSFTNICFHSRKRTLRRVSNCERMRMNESEAYGAPSWSEPDSKWTAAI
jgi:sugar lactone lactonase YvrE